MRAPIRINTNSSQTCAIVGFWMLLSICLLATLNFTQKAEAQISSDVSLQFLCDDGLVVNVPEACSNEYTLKLQGSQANLVDISSELQADFEESVSQQVFFGPVGFTLNAAARQTLAAQASWLQQNPEAILTLIAYSGAVGSIENDEAIGVRRTQAIKTYFIQNGVDSTKISTVIARGNYSVQNQLGGGVGFQQSVTMQVNGFVALPPPPLPVEGFICWDGKLVDDLEQCPTSHSSGVSPTEEPKCLIENKCTGVDVLFGTTQKIDWSIPPEVEGDPLADVSAFTENLKDSPITLDLGVMKVTVPFNDDEDRLDIPRPKPERGFIWKRRAEVLDSAKHYTLYEYEELNEQAFKKSLNGSKSAFIYIHGFKEDAEVAAFKAAQIAEKGFYDGVPTIFTWPSLEANSQEEYRKARINARASAKALSEYIRLVADSVQSDQVHIIAHSMGNHVLLEAMSDIEASLSTGTSLGEVMLAAPDISTSSYLKFVSQNKDRFGGITLYTSDTDVTLGLSQLVCKKRRSELEQLGTLTVEELAEYDSLKCGVRAGYFKISEGQPLLAEGADTIDSSKIEASKAFLNIGSWHSYPFTDSKVLSDMAAIMDPKKRAPTYKRTNLECRLQDGLRCLDSANPPIKHYYTIRN